MHCPCQPRDPIKEQLCSAKLKVGRWVASRPDGSMDGRVCVLRRADECKEAVEVLQVHLTPSLPSPHTTRHNPQLLKEGPQCLQQLASPPAGKLGQQQEQPERRGHRRPRQESQGREKDEEEAAELRASLKRGVLLGVLPALFAPSSSGPGKQGEDAAGSVTDLETSMSSSSGGASSSSGSSSHKAERKEGDTDGEEDEEEGDAGEGEAEERKKEGEGKTARVAYREEEEAMWAYLAQANPEERSRMLVLRDPRRVERLLALTRVCTDEWMDGRVCMDVWTCDRSRVHDDG